MPLLMGIDLGTSSVKVIVMDEDGAIRTIARRDYPVDVPADGHAQQEPLAWWNATADAIAEAVAAPGVDAAAIAGVGLSGQMHGCVLADEQGEALGPAIIHSDQRSWPQVRALYERVGAETIHRATWNALYPGFQLASLAWVLEHTPALYEQARWVLAPKDYVRMKLTGAAAADHSDACATGAYDMNSRQWAGEILTKAGLDPAKMPPIGESADVGGGVSAVAARRTGLRPGTPVVLGGGDQPMQALGNGVIGPGTLTSTIGTAGQVFLPLAQSRPAGDLRTHTFCGLERGMTYAMGAILSAGVCLKWLNGRVLGYSSFEELDREAAAVPVGCHDLLFLPYLSGDRVPFGAYRLKASFVGLTLQHDRAAMARAVLEGVVLAMRAKLDTLLTVEPVGRVIASGGGAGSALWRQIQADVYGRELYRTAMSEQAGVGAAMTAGVGVGAYGSYQQACDAVVRLDDRPVEPNPAVAAQYQEQFLRFREAVRRSAIGDDGKAVDVPREVL